MARKAMFTIVRTPRKKAAVVKTEKVDKPKAFKRKGYDSTLPVPAFSDGGNRYAGKTVENSQILCMLCKVHGCGCVKPARTPIELKESLEGRIHSAGVSLKFGIWRNEGVKAVDPTDQMQAWESRLIKVNTSLAKGLHLVQGAAV